MTDTNKKTRAHVSVSGRVQGVFFRANTYEKAKSLGLTGWVKNLPDGRVEVVVEGEKDPVEEMVKWLKQGPSLARIDNTEVSFEEYTGEFTSFEIRY